MEKLFVPIQRIKIIKSNNKRGGILTKTFLSTLILLMTNVSHAHGICDDSMSEEECRRAFYITSIEDFINETEKRTNEMKGKITETETQLIKLKTELTEMKNNPDAKSRCSDIDHFIDTETDQLCINNGYIRNLPSLYLSDQEECNRAYMESFVNETEKQINEMKRKIIETETQLIKLKTELTEVKNNPDYKLRCIIFGYLFSPETHQLCTNNGYIQNGHFFYCPDTQEELINFLTKDLTEEEVKKFLDDLWPPID